MDFGWLKQLVSLQEKKEGAVLLFLLSLVYFGGHLLVLNKMGRAWVLGWKTRLVIDLVRWCIWRVGMKEWLGMRHEA